MTFAFFRLKFRHLTISAHMFRIASDSARDIDLKNVNADSEIKPSYAFETLQDLNFKTDCVILF